MSTMPLSNTASVTSTDRAAVGNQPDNTPATGGKNASGGGGSTGVTQILAGSGISVSPAGGTGAVTVTATTPSGLPRASGIATLTPSQRQYTIAYGSPLNPAPTKISLTFYTPNTMGSVIGGNVIASLITTTNFAIMLQGPPGDTSHQVFWEAF